MRRATGQALLVGAPQLRPGEPALSALAARIAQTRGLVPGRGTGSASPAARPHVRVPGLSLRSAGLVSAPPDGRTLRRTTQPVAGIALLGAHGGAGVSSLLRAGLDEVAIDARRCWPQTGQVVLVARTSTSGLEWARDLARQHASGLAGDDIDLLGLVLVADAPGRSPARTTDLRELVCGAFDRTWQLPWLEEWRLAAMTEPLPVHPTVRHLIGELARTALPVHRARPA